MSVVVAPSGNYVYAVGYLESSIAVFGRDVETGLLTFLQSMHDDSEGVDGLGGAQSVTVSPDGHHVYTAAYTDDAVAVFASIPPLPGPHVVDIAPDEIREGVDFGNWLPAEIRGTKFHESLHATSNTAP